jgi:hypothetical protein
MENEDTVCTEYRLTVFDSTKCFVIPNDPKVVVYFWIHCSTYLQILIQILNTSLVQRGMTLTTHLQLVPRSRKRGSIHLHGVVFNYLSTGTTLPYLVQLCTEREKFNFQWVIPLNSFSICHVAIYTKALERNPPPYLPPAATLPSPAYFPVFPTNHVLWLCDLKH